MRSDSYVHYEATDNELTKCGIQTVYNASKEWADKKVVLFAVPGQSAHNTVLAPLVNSQIYLSIN